MEIKTLLIYHLETLARSRFLRRPDILNFRNRSSLGLRLQDDRIKKMEKIRSRIRN